MLRTLNCGIGMMIIVPAASVAAALDSLKASGETAVVLGDVVSGTGKVHTSR
jgi:phosphoribosylformylglycinamidine cyclo-ligase